MSEPRPSVFIGSSSEGLPVAQAIQVNLDMACEVVLWSQGVFGLSQGTLESLVPRLETFDFAILIVTPDDMVISKHEVQNAPRDNVLLELGMFIGNIGRERTYVVYDRQANIKLPSDLAGVTAATYQPHSDNNLQAALGAATTQIQGTIEKLGRRQRNEELVTVRKDTEFQIIHDLLDPAIEQYFILMYESGVRLERQRSPFAVGNRYEYHKRDQTGGVGGLSVDELCNRLADADIVQCDLKHRVSLTERGKEYAQWLIERGHKATYFNSDLGSWGERPEEFVHPFARDMAQRHRAATGEA